MSKITEQAKNMWKSLTNAEKTNHTNKELVSNEPIKGTPFKVTGNEELGYFLSLGKYRLSEPTDSKEEAIEMLDTDTWNIICRTVYAYINFNEQQKNMDLLSPVDKELLK